MKGYDIPLGCRICKRDLGIAMMVSNGTMHQWISGVTCLDCLPGAVTEAEAKGVPEDALVVARKMLAKKATPPGGQAGG